MKYKNKKSQQAAEWAKAHPDRVKTWRQGRRARRQIFLAEVKNVPCADCGGRFPTVAMDLDHREPKDRRMLGSSRYGSKGTSASKNFAWILRYFSEEDFLAEVAKCDVVCANCHRVRTAERRLAQEEEAA